MRIAQGSGGLTQTGTPQQGGLFDLLKGRGPRARSTIGGVFDLIERNAPLGSGLGSGIDGPAETAAKTFVSGEFDVAQLQQTKDKVFIDDGAAVMVAEGLGAKCRQIDELSGECTVFGPAKRGAIEAGPSSRGENGEVVYAVETSPKINKFQGVRCWFKADGSGERITSDCEVFDIGVG